MKTLIRLKTNQAAIVFTDKGCQLVYPEGTDTNRQHVTLAAALTTAIQYQVFVDGMYAFLKDVTAVERELTH